MNTIELFDDFLPVDYEKQADQWLELLIKAIKKEIENVGGYGLSHKQASADFRYPHFELKINGMNNAVIDTPLLKIVPVKPSEQSTALYVALAAEREITNKDRSTWSKAIASAVDKLSEESPEYSWIAVLGQANDPTTKKYVLRGKSNVNGITVRSGGQQHIHHTESSQPRFMSSSFNVSWPVVVQGKSKGYNWFVASNQAGLDTYRIALLLSLAWDSTWYLLHTPQPSDDGKIKIPKSSRADIMNHRLPHPKHYKRFPKWTEKAWEVLDEDMSIRNASGAYYQGILMTDKYPSYALIALISSIEAIGKKIIGEKCSCCNKSTGYNQRFRAGVDEVVSDRKKAKEIYRLYESRSGTAHDGQLHGDEDALGSLHFPSMFAPSQSDMFIIRDLQLLRSVSRKLIIKALQGRIKYAL